MKRLFPATLRENLDSLSSDVARMGGLAESMVADAVSAVTRRDAVLAQAVVNRDGRVDLAQKQLEQAVMRLMRERSVGDQIVREGLAAWQIANELERVADLAKSIAKRTLGLVQAEPIHLTRGLERMGRLAEASLKQVLDAHSKRDLQAALAVWRHDEDLDQLYNALVQDLLSHMTKDAEAVVPCTHLLFVAKNIERIGDHCTNIAESVHRMLTGEDIMGERPKSDDSERGDA